MEDKDRFKAKFGSPKMQMKLADHPDENIRGQVAWHGGDEVKRKLENDSSSYVRSNSMFNAPKDMLDRGVKSDDPGTRMGVAQSSTATVEHHRALMHDGDENVRYNVALKAKDPEVLHHLSQDHDWHVKDNVIENPHTSLETLDHMAKTEKHPRIKRAAERMHRGRKDLGGWIPEEDPGTIHHESVKTFSKFKEQVL
jgi:hypothetical protein